MLSMCPMCKDGKMDAKAQEQCLDIGACVGCLSPVYTFHLFILLK